jgi:putative Flp pilus-assembly TadE/G-like protein
MLHTKHESGQALLILVFAIVGLLGMTALTVDGGTVYSDRRNAQNAADTSALGGALASTRHQDINAAAFSRAASNGYNNDHISNDVAVTIVTPLASGACPVNSVGTEITVHITSRVSMHFAPIIGVRQLTNEVFATSRACKEYVAPVFGGNALVALGPAGIDFNATGNPDWTITGSGIFSNSSTCGSVSGGGSAVVHAPYITTVATSCGVSGISGVPVTTNATPYDWAAYKTTLPPTPQCSGTPTHSGTNWYAQAGTSGTNIGTNVALVGDMNFAPGLYCITNSPGSFNGTITGTDVTFYSNVPGFSIKYAGSGASFNAQAPLNAGNAYKGVLMFIEPEVSGNTLLNTQAIDLRGNGNNDLVGSIIAPSADITLFGNSSGSGIYRTQLIGYQIDTGGGADISINYDSAQNYSSPQPAAIQLIK